MHRIIAWNIERWSPLRREAGTRAERPIILNWNKSRSRKLASQIVNVAAVLGRSVVLPLLAANLGFCLAGPRRTM